MTDEASVKEQFKLILAGESGQKYKEQVIESIERALARMQGKDKEGRER